MRLVRVDADREPDLGPEPLDARRLLGFLRVPRLEDDQGALEPGLLRALDDSIEIARERLVGQMAVAVNHQ